MPDNQALYLQAKALQAKTEDAARATAAAAAAVDAASDRATELSGAISGLADRVAEATAAARAATLTVDGAAAAVAQITTSQAGLRTTIDAISTKVDENVTRTNALALEAAALTKALEPPMPLYRSGLPWRSGFRLARNLYDLVRQQYPEVEAFRGRPLDVIGQFITLDNAASWQGMLRNAALGGTTKEPRGCVQAIFDGGWTPVLGVPLLLTTNPRQFDRLARGEFTAQHRTVLQRVAEISQGRLIYLRGGWEYPEGYPWSWIEQNSGAAIPDTAEWQAHYRNGWKVWADLVHEVVPGAKTVWCSLKNTRRATTPYYPGDDAVDVLGMDLYNQLDGVWVNDEASWRQFGGSYTKGRGFNGPFGMAEFAKERGKTVSFCEWGPYNRSKTTGDQANHPFFVQRMFRFFQELAAEPGGPLLEYEIYFQAGGTPAQAIWPEGQFDYNPAPRASYLTCWQPGGGA